MTTPELRIATGATSYSPTMGSFDDKQVEKAREEFDRRVQVGELDVRVVLAERIPAGILETMSVDISGLRLDILYSPDDAFVDVVIFDKESPEHSQVVIRIGQLLSNYVEELATRGHLLVADASTMKWRAGRQTFERTPDSGISFRAGRLRERLLIVEVVAHHFRTLREAQRRCREYINGRNGVRGVLLIMFLGLDVADSTKATAVAILYRLRPINIADINDSTNRVMIGDIVSFGTAAHTATSMDATMLETIDVTLRAPNQPLRDLHGPANNKPLEIPRENVFFGAGVDNEPRLILNLAELFQLYWEAISS